MDLTEAGGPIGGSSPKRLGEFGRIRTHLRPLAAGFPGALGLEDDAAVLTVPVGRELVVTTDAMVEGIHFFADDSPAVIATRLLRVNLSDLAAKGADPLGYCLVMNLPERCDDDWFAAFAKALAEDQARFCVHLIGGDSTATSGPLVVSMTLMGTVPTGKMIRRGGAGQGDRVLVTGTIGDAALGLALRQGWLDPVDSYEGSMLIERLRRPEPRLSLAHDLRRLATAAVDVSDGLVADAGHIALASGLALEIKVAQVPLSVVARRLVAARPSLLALVLTGGDDYEIVITVPPDNVAPMIEAAARLNVAVTEIGEVVSGEPGEVLALDASGRPLPLARRGYTHD